MHLELHDPLPATLQEADPSKYERVLIVTKTPRLVDDELRAQGYQVIWKPATLEDGTMANAFLGFKWAPRKPAKVMIGRLPYGNMEVPDVADWLIETSQYFASEGRIADVRIARIDDTPTSMCRNHLAKLALEWGADVLLFIDADMRPDYLVGNPDHPTITRPFVEVALDHWWNHVGPCMVGAPYVCGGLEERPLIFKWQSPRSPGEQGSYKLTGFGREEAALTHGVTRVSALPTGLLWVDCGVFKQMKKPWFYYEYTDEACTDKASTEDVTFTRDASLQGIPLFCAWDCWAGHWKRKLVGKPEITLPVSIPPFFRNACLRHLNEQPQPNVIASV